jgi:tetratricopeptide (TPR) repeat protein
MYLPTHVKPRNLGLVAQKTVAKLVWHVVLLLTSVLGGKAAVAEEAVADSIRKYRFLAKTAGDRKDYPAAIAYYRRFLEFKPADQRGHYRLGRVFFESRDLSSARASLDEALRLDSTHVNTNLVLFQVLNESGVADAAALCLERVLAKRPGDNTNRRLLADQYRRQNRTQQALRHYTQLAANLRGNSELMEIISVLYEASGESALALEWRQKLLAETAGVVPADQRESLDAMARLQEQMGDIDAAVATLLRLAQVDTVSGYAYCNRIATMAETAGRNDLQQRGLEGMVQANPKDLDSIAILAEMRLTDGDRVAVRRLVAGGLGVDPNHSRLQLLNGDLLALEGAEDEAIAAFEIAKQDPSWERVAQQRIWNLRPPETKEEKLKRAFFSGDPAAENTGDAK